MGGGGRNGEVVRYVASYLLAVIAEWAIFIALLVHIHERDGATVMGIAAAAMLTPYVIVAPFMGRLAERGRPRRVRAVSLLVQVIGYTAAAAAAYADAPTWVAASGGMVAVAALTALRPAGAVLLPALVRSTRELTTANLWVGHAESASVLGAPLVATGLLALGGAPFALAGCAGLTALSLAIALPGAATDPPAPRPPADDGAGAVRQVLTSARVAFRRPGTVGVLAASAAHAVLIGTLDLVIVVSADDVLGLGETGAGVLGTLFGAGAAGSIAINAVIARRPQVAPFLTAALAVLVVGAALLGVHIALLTVVIALPLLGAAQSTIDLLARMLLQRSAPPSDLGSLFSILEVGLGVGLLGGSVLGQILIAISGPQAAMIGIAVVFGLLLITTGPSLRRADAIADVPVVSMSRLHRDPVFAPLPTIDLENVARSAIDVQVSAGEPVVRQGEPGTSYYLIVDGSFDVHLDDRYVRTLGRGQAFGEIALIADVPRTASVTATTDGRLLEIDRGPFLTAVTGHDSSHRAVWSAVTAVDLGSTVIDPDLLGPTASDG